MTTQEQQEGERRARAYRGFVMMALGLFVLFIAAVRDDDHSWQGFLVAGISLALGAFFLAWARRS